MIVIVYQVLGMVVVLFMLIIDQDGVMVCVVEVVIVFKDINGMLGLYIEGLYIDYICCGMYCGVFVCLMEQQIIDIVCCVWFEGFVVMIIVFLSGVGIVVICELLVLGVVVFIGYSDVIVVEIKVVIVVGVICGMYLFNVMLLMISCEFGMVGVIINFDCYFGIICDGYYVVDDMIVMVICVCLCSDWMFFVLDVMLMVGGLDYFKFYDVIIWFEDGWFVNDEGSFVGVYVI